MRPECPQSHQDQGRPGTHRECGDCPLRVMAAIAQPLDEPQPTAEVATRTPYLPGQITDQAKAEAQKAIEISLAAAEQTLARHVFWPSRAALDTVLMWIAHANARERDNMGMPGQIIWPATPRLMLTSKVNQSGKSTALTLLAYLCGSRFGRITPVTANGFAVVMGEMYEPAMLDDVKTLFGRGEKAATLQGMLLNGYTPDVVSLNAIKGGTHRNLFGVAAYAAKDDLITTNLTGTIEDLLSRSIIIDMRRPTRFYLDVDEDARSVAKSAQKGFAAWAYVMTPELKAASRRLGLEAVEAGELAQTEVDKGILRKAQLFRSLIACADVIGGDWPERIRTAASPASETSDIIAQIQALDGLLGDVAVTFSDE